VALAVIVLLSHPAWAGRGAIDVEHFRPQIDGRGLFSAESADAHARFEWGVGFMLHYVKNPLVFSSGGGKAGDLVNDRLTGELLLSLGLASWLEVGAALPFAFANDQNAALGGATQVTGLGSTRVQLKFRFLREGAHGIGLALATSALLPTGNANAFLGQNGIAISPVVLVERSLGPTRMLLNVGYTVRSRTAFRDLVVGDALLWRVGFSGRVGERLEIGVELVGSTAAESPFGSDERHNPFEALLGARVLLGSRLALSFGAGPGLSRGYGAPALRAFAGLSFSPHQRDTDGDGVPDARDRCPAEAGSPSNAGCPVRDRDRDGLEDDRDACPDTQGPRENRGCPWPDSDGDGVLDKDDACPRVPGVRANRGCPWPDTDGDGVPDRDDACPYVKGPRENRGCPLPSSVREPPLSPALADRDGDGVPDRVDRCPDVPGAAKNKGCPWPDTDGDGVTDNEDDCPTERGPRSNRGCPVR
jgi:hypothetical protein